MFDPRLLLAVLLVLVAGLAAWLCQAALRGVPSGLSSTPPAWLPKLGRFLAGPLLGFRLVGGAVAGVVVWLGTQWPVAAGAIALLVWCWPALFGSRKATKDGIAQLDALVMWTESLRDTVSGAVGLAEAIPASVDTSPTVLRPALVRLRGLLEAREPMSTALEELSRDLADPSADQVVRALMMHEESRGPGLEEALDGLAESTREELDLRRRIDGDRAGERRNVQIIVVLTVAMAVAFALFFPPALSAPYRTFVGQMVLLVVCGIFAGGFLWLRRLGSPDVGELLDTDVPDVFASGSWR